MFERDRRSPRITVQQLRRDLREADEQRYRLTTAGRSGPTAPRIVALLVLFASALGGAFWTMRAPTLTAEAVPAPQAMVHKPVAVIAIPDTPRPASAVDRRPPVPVPRRVKAPNRSPAPARAPAERRVPRPRHPGEFGQPDLTD